MYQDVKVLKKLFQPCIVLQWVIRQSAKKEISAYNYEVGNISREYLAHGQKFSSYEEAKEVLVAENSAAFLDMMNDGELREVVA